MTLENYISQWYLSIHKVISHILKHFFPLFTTSLTLICCLSCKTSTDQSPTQGPSEILVLDEKNDDDKSGSDTTFSFGNSECSDEKITPNNRIIIVDQTGKRWDISYAVEAFGFEPSRFQFGLGPDAIKPILNATMLSPGDQGYPLPNKRLVLATRINNKSRAYPIDIMSQHEIVDERFGDTHTAVAY